MTISALALLLCQATYSQTTSPATTSPDKADNKGVVVSLDNLEKRLFKIEKEMEANNTNGTVRNYEEELSLQGTYTLRRPLTELKNIDGSDAATEFPIGTHFTFVKKDGEDIWISPDCALTPFFSGTCAAAKKAGGEKVEYHPRPVDATIFKVPAKTLPDGSYSLSRALVHGVLLVPFKLRLEDQSLTGQSTIGYYIGSRSDTALGSGTAFFSAGLTFVNGVDEDKPEENTTALSTALGYSFATKSNFQAALMLGVDHLGGSQGDDWIYEDDPWVSIGIGYKFLSN